MASPILIPTIIGLSVLFSYVSIRLYKCLGNWWPKAKPSKVDLLPITGLPPPTLVDISTPRTPTTFYQHISKQIHPTSFPRPPSPHALLATTPPPKLRRSKSLGGVPVRRLSGGASGLRNVQILDLDMEMQEMNRDTSREHLLIDFSSSGSSDDPDAWRKENEEGIASRRISPASSDIGVLPSHHHPYHANDLTLDLAPGKKLVQLVDFTDVEHGLAIKKDNDSWTWSPLPPKIHFTSPSLPKSISKSISESFPVTPLPLPMPEGKLIDFHPGTEEEHVLVDLDMQDDNNVPQHEQPEFIHVHTTRVDLDLPITKPPKMAVDVKQLDDTPTPLQDKHSLDSLMKPVTITDTTIPDPEIQSPISFSVVEGSSQRGQRVDCHPLEEVHEAVIEKVEVTAATGTTMEIMKDDEELANEHENYELHDHYDDYSNAYNMHHSPQSLDTTQGEQLQSSSSSQIATIPPQAAPLWYWDHEDDPWNMAVGVNEDVNEGERGTEEELLGESGGKVGEGGDIGVDVSEMEAVGEGEDILEASLGGKVPELPVEYSPEMQTVGEDSHPDPDYLPLPELLLGPSPAAAPEVPLVLLKNEHFQEDEDAIENQTDDQDGGEKLLQQSKDDEESPRRKAAQMPTPPASPPTSLRVKGLGGAIGTRSRPPSPSSLPSIGGLLPMASVLPLPTPQPTSPKLAPSLVSTPNTSGSSPAMELHVKVSEGDQDDADKENETPDNTIGRPLWSMRASDAPALGLAASSLSLTPPTVLTPGIGTTMGVSPRMRRRVLGDVPVVENGEREQVEIREKGKEVKEPMLKEEKDKEDEESSLPGAFPELLNTTTSSDTNPIILPTITIAALTSTLLSTSINATSSTSPASASSTALETLSPVIQRRPRQHIVRSPLDIALAMQLRPGLGVGADPAWMVRFLMAMFGWFTILVSGQGEF